MKIKKKNQDYGGVSLWLTSVFVSLLCIDSQHNNEFDGVVEGKGLPISQSCALAAKIAEKMEWCTFHSNPIS
tara:strand:- start:842 stop:1057 length:216 start_codon:yes stop_codon:yes gene_type:complete